MVMMIHPDMSKLRQRVASDLAHLACEEEAEHEEADGSHEQPPRPGESHVEPAPGHPYDHRCTYEGGA